MICKNDITSIRADIGENVGQKIIVKGSLGRSKLFEKQATIEKTYQNIFIIKYDDNDRNVTYSYTDVLTRTIEMEVFNGKDYTPLMPEVVEEKKRRRKLS
ncbi:MAG: Veg family protein [Clostridia bacterium]|nr:Veg family protein [Clostridia bacterium]